MDKAKKWLNCVSQYTYTHKQKCITKTGEICLRLVGCINVNILVVILHNSLQNLPLGKTGQSVQGIIFVLFLATAYKSKISSISKNEKKKYSQE